MSSAEVCPNGDSRTWDKHEAGCLTWAATCPQSAHSDSQGVELVPSCAPKPHRTVYYWALSMQPSAASLSSSLARSSGTSAAGPLGPLRWLEQPTPGCPRPRRFHDLPRSGEQQVVTVFPDAVRPYSGNLGSSRSIAPTSVFQRRGPVARRAAKNSASNDGRQSSRAIAQVLWHRKGARQHAGRGIRGRRRRTTGTHSV